MLNLENKRIILGSQSPRRSQLLKELGLEFEVIVRETDEIVDPNLSPEEVVKSISKKKAEAGRKHPKYGKPELDIVQMMSQTFSLTDAEIDSFALDEKDFQTLITLASSTNNKDVCKKLILALSKNIFADRSYPPTTLNDLWFE